MQRPREPQNINDAAYYKAVIRQHPLFAKWPAEVITDFAKLWSVVKYEPSKIIVKEGAQINNVYLIVAGNCEVVSQAKDDPSRMNTLAILSPGESVGLSSTGLFSTTSQRTATVIALSNVTMVEMHLKTLQKFLQDHPNLSSSFETSVSRVFRIELAKQYIPYAKLDLAKLNEIANSVEEIQLPAQSVIFDEGDFAEDCFLLAEGRVEISKKENDQKVILATLLPTATFGEVSLVFNMKRNSRATTLTATKLYRLHRTELTKAFSNEIEYAANLPRNALKHSIPIQSPNIAERHETSADKNVYIVLKNLKTKEYYSLNAKSYFAWTYMDGKNNLDTIIQALNQKFNEDTTDETIYLIADLHRHGFITVSGYRFPKTSKGFWASLRNFFSAN